MNAAATLDYGFAKRHGVLLVDLAAVARVGLREGADPRLLLELRRALGRPLDVVPMARSEFDRRLSEVYASDALNDASLAGHDDIGPLDALAGDLPTTADLLENQDDAPVIRLINGLIAEAARQGASDVHVEPFETSLRVADLAREYGFTDVDGRVVEAFEIDGI